MKNYILLPILLMIVHFGFSQTTSIPDANFEAYLEANGMGDGIANNQLVTTANINTVTNLDISNQSIANLTGIEDFIALTELICYNNSLTSLDISANTALTVLECGINSLTTLNVSTNVALTTLTCDNNSITSLNVSTNTALDILKCQNNALTSLNVKNGNNANMLNANINTINNSNLSCIEVDNITYSTTNWTNIDPVSNFSENCFLFFNTFVPDNNFEAFLEANNMGNGIANDDYVTTANINMVTTLDVNNQNIADLTGIEAFTALTNLDCNNNQLTSLNVSQNTALISIHCQINQLTTLDLSANILLEALFCYNNQLTILDLSQNTAIAYLQCNSNQLTSLDVTQNTLLAELRCANNQLTNLDLSQNTALTDVRCDNNQLTNLDISQSTALTILQCNNNQLTSLNAKNGTNTAITSFIAISNSDLSCIEVDDPAYSASNWTIIDPASSFSTNCHYDETNVPDDNFETYLETHDASGNVVSVGDPTSMGNGIANDDYVTTAKINNVTTLTISGESISDLTGIEAFTALTQLDCSFNDLTALDVSSNMALVELWCYGNFSLSSLNVSGISTLTRLECYNAALTSLDVSTNTALQYLYFAANQLTNIDVSANTALLEIKCHSNFLSSLDVSTNTALTGLFCQLNQLTTLDVSANTALVTLYCYSNQLTSIDVSGNTALTGLFCFGNQLTNLNVKNANNTNFISFNATSNPNLTCIKVDDQAWSTNNWTQIDPVSSFAAYCMETNVPDDNFEAYLETHDASGNVVSIGDPMSMGNGITNDDIVYTAKINTVTTLTVSGLNISNLTGIEAFTALNQLDCSFNNLTVLDVSSSMALVELWCYSNFSLSSLNVSGITTLTRLECHNAALTSLDVSTNTALQYLYFAANQLTNIDVSANTALLEIKCHSNFLSSLDVSTNTALTGLFCQLNQLTTLDLSVNTVLVTLYCYSNQLTNIDVSGNTALTGLFCFGNQLTNLNVKNGNNTNFISFNATNNPNLTCIEVVDQAWSTTNWTQIDPASHFSTNCMETYIADDNFEAYLETHDASGNVVSVGDPTSMGNGIANDDYVTTAKINIVTTLTISSKSISDLTGIEAFTALTQLDCSHNNLTTLDASSNTALVYLFCNNNSLINLNVSSNTALIGLYCYNNSLITLDVSSNTALLNLDCYGNSLTTLDVSSNTALIYLECSFNNLTGLDVSANVALTELLVDHNSLTSIDLSANTALTELYCDYNQLTSIDVSSNITLDDFSCRYNQLTSLNAKNGNNTALIYFSMNNNPNLTCIEVDDPSWSSANWTNIDPASSFSEDCNANYKIGNITYSTLQDAINAVVVNDTIEVMNNVVETTNATIVSGITLKVPGQKRLTFNCAVLTMEGELKILNQGEVYIMKCN